MFHLLKWKYVSVHYILFKCIRVYVCVQCNQPIVISAWIWMRRSRKLHENAFYFMHVFHFSTLFIRSHSCTLTPRLSGSLSLNLLCALKTAIDLHDANMHSLVKLIISIRLEGPHNRTQHKLLYQWHFYSPHHTFQAFRISCHTF